MYFFFLHFKVLHFKVICLKNTFFFCDDHDPTRSPLGSIWVLHILTHRPETHSNKMGPYYEPRRPMKTSSARSQCKLLDNIITSQNVTELFVFLVASLSPLASLAFTWCRQAWGAERRDLCKTTLGTVLIIVKLSQVSFIYLVQYHNLPQGALQSVQHTTPSVLQPLIQIRKNSPKK